MMKKKLLDSIQQLGGKEGTLYFLRTEDPEIGQYILPSVSFSVAEGYSEAVAQRVTRMCEENKCEKIIVRTSVKAQNESDLGDLDGIVDKTPSIKTTLDNVVCAVEEILEKLFDSSLKNSIEAEGKYFDPKETTISVVPRHNNNWVYTLTQNPNQEDIFFNDSFLSAEGMTPRENCAETIIGENNYPLDNIFNRDSEIQKFTEKALDIIKKIENNYLPGHSLQLEFGSAYDRPVLFQVRSIGPKVTTELLIKKGEDSGIEDDELELEFEERESIQTRVFGVTPEEGLALKVCLANERIDFIRFEERNPGVKYVGVLEHDTCSDKPLTLEEQPKNMLAYFSNARGSSMSLTHQHTRFVQEVLKKGGVAVLGEGVRHLLNGRVDEEIVLYSDGKNVKIEDSEAA